MAVNPDNSLPNRHHLYLGDTGSGKSQALKQNPEIPKSGVPVILWDPKQDHKCSRFADFPSFKRALLAAFRSGKGFRVGLSLPIDQRTRANHEKFCELVAKCLDGRFITYVIDEELAEISDSAGKADRWHGFLLTQGRGYGLRYHGVIQYPQEFSKTVYRAARVLWVGIQDVEAVGYVARRLGVKNEEVADLKPLEFFVQDKDKEPVLRREKLQYKKI